MSNFSIISSLLDNDFYKFIMQYAVIKLFPKVKAKYKFINRGEHTFPKNFDKILKENLKNMSYLTLSNEEKTFLKKNIPYLDSKYLNFLKKFKYNHQEITISQKDNYIKINIEGLWYRTILWEVPIMAIISELYYKLNGIKELSNKEIKNTTIKKIDKYKKLKVKIGEYGTRRRFSYNIHKQVIKILIDKGSSFFLGSSNVHLSHIFSKKPIGTVGHEWIMFHAAKYGFNFADKIAMKNWIKIYKSNLGFALSDTYTSNIFFKNFNKKLSNLFDGIRHDSGDPYIFIKKTIKHYKKYKINPLEKKIIFSDNLNPDKVSKISSFCKGKISPYFGIGTNFTNDLGIKPMNIVIKMVKSFIEKKWISVVKLSNIKGKTTGNKNMVFFAKKILRLNKF